MAIDNFEYTHPNGWEDSVNFPTTPANETQTRQLLQQQHKEVRDYLKTKLVPGVNAHLAEMATKTDKVPFSCTPEVGFNIPFTECYVKDKLAYLNIQVRKDDGTEFTTAATFVAKIPSNFTIKASVASLSATGLTSGGAMRSTVGAQVVNYNKSISTHCSTSDIKNIYITGVFEIS